MVYRRKSFCSKANYVSVTRQIMGRCPDRKIYRKLLFQKKRTKKRGKKRRIANYSISNDFHFYGIKFIGILHVVVCIVFSKNSNLRTNFEHDL